MQENDKCRHLTQEAVYTIAITVIWYLFAHGYRFANNLYSHDALLDICQDDSAWEIALGRFVHPVLIFLRGNLESPWLISVCAMVWISLGIWLIIHMLSVKHVISVIIIAGIMVCNPTLVSTNASFLPWVDFYGLALFLSIFGIWLCKRGGRCCSVCGIMSMMLSLGIYQAYICVSIVLVMILLLREGQENTELKEVVKKAVYYGSMLFLSALLYYLVWKIVLSVFGIWTADSYHGMASLGDYSEESFLALLVLAYERVFQYFWHPDTFVTMMFRGISLSIVWKYILRCANIMAVASLIWNVAVFNIKMRTRLWQRLFQVGILLLLPMGMNFVCILSKGVEHILMVYAFGLLYVLAVVMAEAGCLWNKDFTGNKNFSGNKDCSGTRGKSLDLRRILVCLSVLCVIWSNVVYANQIYLKKELQERAMTSLMTRIVAEIEGMEGYIPGVTPVAFSGSFENSPYLQQIAGFEDLRPQGMGDTILTYTETDYAFLKYEVSILMNYTRIDATEAEVMGMPTYPSQGSIAYVGDILVVKIAE